MSLALSYDPTLSRVQLLATTWGASVEYVIVDRFDNVALTNPDVVRGGGHVELTMGDTLRLDDYEFTPGVENTYRVRAYNSSDVLLPTYSYTQAITPTLTSTWLKSIARPFLNRVVTVQEWSDVVRPERGGLFEVRGRRLPIAVNDVRGSRRFTLTLLAEDDTERAALERLFAFGDVLLLQPADGCAIPGPLYAQVGDLTTARQSRRGVRRYLDVPITEVAAPSPELVGATITWAGVVSGWATWADLIADPDTATWLDVMEFISSPEDETVG